MATKQSLQVTKTVKKFQPNIALLYSEKVFFLYFRNCSAIKLK